MDAQCLLLNPGTFRLDIFTNYLDVGYFNGLTVRKVEYLLIISSESIDTVCRKVLATPGLVVMQF